MSFNPTTLIEIAVCSFYTIANRKFDVEATHDENSTEQYNPDLRNSLGSDNLARCMLNDVYTVLIVCMYLLVKGPRQQDALVLFEFLNKGWTVCSKLCIIEFNFDIDVNGKSTLVFGHETR